MSGAEPSTAGEELAAAVASGNAELIAEVATRKIWPLFNHDYLALVTAVGMVPETVLQRYPVLRLLHPVAPVLARSNRPFDPAAFDSTIRNAKPQETDLLMVMQIIAPRMSGDLSTALRYARRLEERIRRTPVLAEAHGESPLWFFHHQIGSTYLMAGDCIAALREFGTARQLGEFSSSGDASRSTLGRTALAHAVRGSLDDAEQALAKALAMEAPSPAYAGAAYGTERAAAALIGVERLSVDVAERVSSLDSVDSVDVVWPFLLSARTKLALSRQDPARALEAVHLAAASHLIQAGTFASDTIASVGITAALAFGDLAGAEDAVEAAGIPGPQTQFAMIRIALAEGDFVQAHQQMIQIGSRQGLSPAERAQLTVLKARLAELEFGKIDAKLAAEFAAVLLRDGYRSIVSTVPKSLTGLVRAELPVNLVQSFEEELADLVLAPSSRVRPALTSGEQRVLNELPRHKTVAEIASALGVSPNTVKTQLRSLYRKLGVVSRSEAIEAGLSEISPRRS